MGGSRGVLNKRKGEKKGQEKSILSEKRWEEELEINRMGEFWSAATPVHLRQAVDVLCTLSPHTSPAGRAGQHILPLSAQPSLQLSITVHTHTHTNRQ